MNQLICDYLSWAGQSAYVFLPLGTNIFLSLCDHRHSNCAFKKTLVVRLFLFWMRNWPQQWSTRARKNNELCVAFFGWVSKSWLRRPNYIMRVWGFDQSVPLLMLCPRWEVEITPHSRSQSHHLVGLVRSSTNDPAIKLLSDAARWLFSLRCLLNLDSVIPDLDKSWPNFIVVDRSINTQSWQYSMTNDFC